MNRTTGVAAPLSPLLMRGNEPEVSGEEAPGKNPEKQRYAAALPLPGKPH